MDAVSALGPPDVFINKFTIIKLNQSSEIHTAGIFLASGNGPVPWVVKGGYVAMYSSFFFFFLDEFLFLIGNLYLFLLKATEHSQLSSTSNKRSVYIFLDLKNSVKSSLRFLWRWKRSWILTENLFLPHQNPRWDQQASTLFLQGSFFSRSPFTVSVTHICVHRISLMLLPPCPEWAQGFASCPEISPQSPKL